MTVGEGSVHNLAELKQVRQILKNDTKLSIFIREKSHEYLTIMLKRHCCLR